MIAMLGIGIMALGIYFAFGLLDPSSLQSGSL